MRPPWARSRASTSSMPGGASRSAVASLALVATPTEATGRGPPGSSPVGRASSLGGLALLTLGIARQSPDLRGEGALGRVLQVAPELAHRAAVVAEEDEAATQVGVGG